jgi:hypothetical protein
MNQALYGHTSEETAYLVSDYPYGFRARCRIRYWVEYNPKNGYRFVSQTENPKTLRWNAPKKGTYSLLAGGMYVNEEGHVSYLALSYHDHPEEFLRFTTVFQDLSDDQRKKLLDWCILRLRSIADFLAGTRYFTINGERVELTETDRARYLKEQGEWFAVAELLNPTVAV